VAILLGVAFSLACFQYRKLRLFMTFLSPAAVVFPLVFLFHFPVYKLSFSKEVTSVAAAKIGAPAPIVMVIFDEFPLASLLDETATSTRFVILIFWLCRKRPPGIVTPQPSAKAH
jgi:hypothetical protein